MASPAPSFDPNVCIGYKAEQHPFPEAELRPASYLCPDCDDVLNNEVAVSRLNARQQSAAAECPAGGHPRGSRYYSCLACYGD